MCTIEYYNSNAKEYFNNTINANMSNQYEMLEKHLNSNARILDLGCGSGRDSHYFINKGFKTTALDGSKELCKLAEETTGQQVICKDFLDIDFNNEFDAIWACASLLHLDKDELELVLNKLEKALVKGGYLYASFKYGEYEGQINGRYYLYQTEQSLSSIINKTNFTIIETKITDSVIQDRDEKWLNVILKIN